MLERPLTEPYSLERQHRLAKASSHGAATSGGHVTTDDFFKTIEIPIWEAESKITQDQTDDLALLEMIESKGKVILTLEKPVSALHGPEL